MKVFVIIPAAGLGTRMIPAAGSKAKKPAASKQFAELGGASILMHTLQKFVDTPEVSEIHVALRENEMAGFQIQLQATKLKKPVKLVAGGEHRQNSVANALAGLTAADDDIVLVHDAVRPFVSPNIIGEVIAAARKYGAAIAGLPSVDTVKQVDRTADGALIKTTLPRERIVMAQTPQGFRYDLLKKVFDEAAVDGFMGTDEASLIERAGKQVMVVMGSPRNIKITTPADMKLAEFYLKSGS